MATIISHNPKNQLFSTRQQANDALDRNGLKASEFEYTLPCSFDEKERTRFDINRDDEDLIKVYVIYDGYGAEPILYGFLNEYVVRDRESGNVIEHVRTYIDGVNLIAELETQDKEDGIYTPDFYEVVPSDNYVVSEDEKWLENWLKSLPNEC